MPATTARAGLAAFLCAIVLGGGHPAGAQTGGTTGAPGSPAAGPPKRAKLKRNGEAVAPTGAPLAVVNAIAAGNRIRKRPYIYGGGHGSFEDKGYDCSGAVSYVLAAAGMLSNPLPSGPLMYWGSPGMGRWVTVYANKRHTYAVIAGLRWDTSGTGRGGKGPRWRASKRKPTGFAVRHYYGY